MSERTLSQIGVYKSCDDPEFRQAEPEADKLRAILHHQSHRVSVLQPLGFEYIGNLVAEFIYLQVQYSGELKYSTPIFPDVWIVKF